MKRMSMVLLVSVCLVSGLAQAKTYKLGMVPWAGFSPANVADVKGFWKALGLDVKVFMLPGNDELQKALVQQRIDFSIDITGFWVDRVMEGIPITVLAEIDWSHGGDKILLRPGIQPMDLKGQVIGMYNAFSPTLPLLHRYLKDQGLQVADVKRVAFAAEDLPEKMKRTKMLAAVCFDPYALSIEKDGTGVVVASSATYPGSIADSIGMRTDVLRETPREDVVKFLKGWLQAVAWIQDEAHWAEYAEILNQQTFQSATPLADAELRGILAGVKIHDAAMLRQQHQPGSGIFVYLQELKTILAANQLLSKDFVPTDLVDSSFLLEALKAYP